MEASVRGAGPFGAVLACCLALMGCAGNSSLSGPGLAERLSGRTVVFDAPEGLPAERTTYNADGTLRRLFRPVLLPETLSEGTGYWWVENGRYCTSGNPRSESDVASCFNVTINGDRIRFEPWREPRLFDVIPELRSTSEGTLID